MQVLQEMHTDLVQRIERFERQNNNDIMKNDENKSNTIWIIFFRNKKTCPVIVIRLVVARYFVPLYVYLYDDGVVGASQAVFNILK